MFTVLQRFAWPLFFCLLCWATPGLASGGGYRPPQDTPLLGIRILHALPHDPLAFTQGLCMHDGKIYESTGRYGESELRVLDAASGKLLRRRALPNDLFGEGLTLVGQRLLQLTWRSGRVLFWQAPSLERMGEARLPGDSWGLAAGPDLLYRSDGSATLQRLRPHDLQPAGSLTVHDQGHEVRQLNELEWVNGRLVANIWFEDVLAVIDPVTGQVQAWVDLSPLRPLLWPDAGVANGTAWDGRNLYVTGKNWNKLFVLRIPNAPWDP